MLLVAFIMTLRVQSTNQGSLMMHTKLFPSSIVAVMMMRDQEHPSYRIERFPWPANLTYNLWSLRHTLLTTPTTLHHRWWYIQQFHHLFGVKSSWHQPLNHWLPWTFYNVMWCLLVAEMRCRRCKLNTGVKCAGPSPGQDCLCWSQPMGSQHHGDWAGEGWLDNTIERE